MVKNVILLLGLLLSSAFSYGQKESDILSKNEIAELNEALMNDTLFAQVVKQIGDPVKLYENFKLNVYTSDSIWAEDQKNLTKIIDIGVTEHFKMLPLIDCFTDDSSLKAEAGVSYFIETDEITILFDVGLNTQNSHPSPLLNNLNELGVKLDDIDIIVISHNHGDHIGGGIWSAKNTFSLSGQQIDLGQKKVYTPETMTYPGLDPVYSHDPVRIAKGVATIGIIPGPMFFTNVGEQSIAINVQDKGIVIISGCGHQTIEKIVCRTKILFDEPIYGLLGGFHLPLTESRHIGRVYSLFVTGKLPWDSLKKEDVKEYIALLKKHDVKVVGISGHDSCDWSINAFKQAFQDNYKDIVVGEEIRLNHLVDN